MGAAVIALDHPRVVGGVDPQIVVIAMAGRDLVEGRSAVGGFPHLQIGDVDRVGVARIGEDMRVVPGPVHQVAIGRHHRPAQAVVVGAVEAGLVAFGLDQRPYTAGAGGRNRHADLADHAVRQARLAGDLFPRVAAVGAPEQPAARAAARNVPEVAPRFPHRGEQEARVGAVHRELDRARHVAAIEDFLPILAAVRRAIDAALGIGTEHIAQHCGIDEIGIRRMDADAADELAVAEADMAPGAARVARFVNAVAVGHIEADRRFTGARIDHVGVRGRDRDRTDRGAAHEAVRDAAPEYAAVLGLPDAAGTGPEIEHHPIHRIARNGDDAAAARGADAAPFQRVETGRWGGAGFFGHGTGCRSFVDTGTDRRSGAPGGAINFGRPRS